MANRQTRNPGNLQSFDGIAHISSSVPYFAVDDGDAYVALANVAGSLSGRLKALADQAAAREGALAGLSAGQRNGAGYLQARAAEQQASSRVSKAPANAAEVKSYLIGKHGLSDAQASGIVGNLIQESRLRASGAVGDAGTAFGIAQWRGKRLTNLKAFAAERTSDWEDLHTQLDFIMHELSGTEKSAGDRLRSAQTVEDATAAFISFERPRGWTTANPKGGHGWSNRLAHARKVAGGDVAVSSYAADRPETLSTQPLQLRRDGTIRGEAFDDAAMRAYAWRVDQGLATDLANADIEFGDDPAGLASRINEIHDHYRQDEAFEDPQMREGFERSFAARSEAYRLKAASRQETRLRQEEQAAANDGIEARGLEIERQAYTMGANPEGDRIIGEQLGRAGIAIDAAVEAGSITPMQGARAKQNMATGAARGRVQGTFDALEMPAEKEQFALSLLEDWGQGEGPLAQLPLDTVKSLSTSLFNEARRLANAGDGEARATKARIDQLLESDVASIAATGQPVDMGQAGTDLETIRAALTPTEFQAWQTSRETAEKLYQSTAGMEGQPPQEIANRLETLKPQPGQPDYQTQKSIYEAAQTRAASVLKQREQDPLGQANEAGLVDLAPLDAPTAEALDEFLAGRASQARTVSQVYGTAFQAFRPGEAEQLAASMLSQPELLPAFAAGVRTAFGERASQVLSEISPHGPIAAHSAGISLATGDTSIANDVARTMSNRAQKIYTLKMPSQSRFVEASQPMIAGALAAVPATSSAAIGTAALLYEQAANAQGFDPDDIGKEGTPAHAAWNQALNRSLGGRTINGVAWGGIGTVGKRTIIVPPDMPRGEPENLLGNLTDLQLDFMPPIATANGYRISARQIRNGNLVTVGNGVYRVALGDPDSQAPQYLSTPDGRFWELDIRFLQNLQNQ